MEVLLSKLVEGQENKKGCLTEIKADLLGLNQKVESYATTIKQLEQKFSPMSVVVNQRQPGTLPIRTMVNPKNGSHCHAITIRSGKITVDLPVLTVDEQQNDDDYVDLEIIRKQDRGKYKIEDLIWKFIPRPRPPFPQRMKEKKIR